MKTKNLMRLGFIVFMWGSAFPLVKIALAEVQPITLGFLRFLIATPLLAIYAAHNGSKDLVTVAKTYPIPLALMALTGVMSYQVCQNIGVKLTSATNSSIIISSDPIMIALLSTIFLKEKMSPARAAGILMGFLGVIVIVLSKGQGVSVGSPSFTGDLFSIGAALSWSVYSVVGRSLASQISPTRLTAVSTVLGTMFLVFPTFLLETPTLPSTAPAWAAVLALSIGSTCMAYALWNQVLAEEEATRSGLSLFLVPVVTATLSVYFLSEALTLPLLVGTALVFSGIVISERG